MEELRCEPATALLPIPAADDDTFVDRDDWVIDEDAISVVVCDDDFQ